MKALALLAAMLVTASVVADEDPLPQASVADIKELVQVCHQMATEDEVTKAELQDYLLDCVNDQLNEMGYQRVESLQKFQ
ncbi:hypothetical protein KDN34_01510 [Shewanella yunxiaonensis]|uniref:Uncharacterized protein n=1 Tax=Shewanella yunxiaonensis TaxID=2829809 RepID=A0ABX7YU51_9GAMM|nr:MULTISPECIES: hypothetical protein [Shewanella]MDF0535166.1 hypothetical protein [Shewanella sp. A32]QUN06179.1 hypothetical protein KDN34_01510 [Shewanella yunxiaonensis]